MMAAVCSASSASTLASSCATYRSNKVRSRMQYWCVKNPCGGARIMCVNNTHLLHQSTRLGVAFSTALTCTSLVSAIATALV